MNHSFASEFALPGPVTSDWTILELLEWIGADDARCHDPRLTEILDAVNGALGTPGAVAPVVSVRALALRVSADPAVGERRLGDVILAGQDPVAEPVHRGALLAV